MERYVLFKVVYHSEFKIVVNKHGLS